MYGDVRKCRSLAKVPHQYDCLPKEMCGWNGAGQTEDEVSNGLIPLEDLGETVDMVSRDEHDRVTVEASVLRAKLHHQKERARNRARAPSVRTVRRAKQNMRAIGKLYGVDVHFGRIDTSKASSTKDIVRALDESNLSLRKYDSLRKNMQGTPSLYQVRKERNIQNDEVDRSVQSIPNGSMRSIESVVRSVQPKVHKDGAVRIKLSADGANVGKFRTFTNFSVTFVDETDANVRGPHLVAVLEACERYENVQQTLKKYDAEVARLNAAPVKISDDVQAVQ